MSADVTLQKKIGRPPKLPPRDAATRIEKLAAARHTKLGIAKSLGTSLATLNRWMSDDADLAEAFDRGRDVIEAALTSVLLDKAMKGETVPLLFALKGMFGWREGEANQQGSGGVALTFNFPQPMAMKDFIDANSSQSLAGVQSLPGPGTRATKRS